MKIALVDADSHNFPNVPLMKVSSFHKNAGDDVEFIDYQKEYDRVYISKVFTESIEPIQKIKCSDIRKGGSGYDLKNKLPTEIEHSFPDYSLYPGHKFAAGFLTRGCPRCNHTYCITPEKDGVISLKVADLSEFWNGQKEIKLIDQNILACKQHNELFEQLVDSKTKIEFNGGLDVRFMDETAAKLLSQMNITIQHFAWDDPREDLRDKYTWLRPYLHQCDRNITCLCFSKLLVDT